MSRPRTTHRRLVMLVLLWPIAAVAGCGGKSAQDAGADGGPNPAADPSQEIGGFDLRLVRAVPASMGVDAVPAYTAFLGGVRTGPLPERTLYRKSGESGGCALYEPEIPFCDPSCYPAVCVANDRCAPEPTERNAGRVFVNGLRTETGSSPVELLVTPGKFSYQLPTDLKLAYPPFAPAAPIEVSGSGGDIGPFTIAGKGISPLDVLTAVPITVESGRPMALRWMAPAAGEANTIQIALDLSFHGGTKGKIECEVPDSGSMEIPGPLLARLIALGTAGFPSVWITRSSVSTARLPSGRVKLSLISDAQLAIVIPGQISCENPEDCPSGQICRGNLLCGAP